ncbi:aldo/keto reductase [Furfurilactobacillus siliginis]|uniref:Glyceraldehyde 3-phosphate reductase n=1 Tax=Furfurilactobacillus siliginis TaxID=348151 RepID=A0A0R2LBN9_9LACO|nr:aldo/keto reductase [Furfurilactobacillus siliginis]KRN97189.1 oxidoreductase, aldo keto reductase family protein [Furfurilactobacillus siliginis]GEK28651.1 glyceraldehyde 3-phosphate reductase [Furfurilactobacillus siliginis]
MYQAQSHRYEDMQYRRAGKSGLTLSAIGLGLWHNFGSVDVFATQKEILHTAFDAGITYFDLANNYGPEPGSAETNFGKIMHSDFARYRDEMIIATKAGHRMWDGPYGDGGSMKNIMASADQSLQRMQLDYVDIFYSHRPDPDVPVAETAYALDKLVKQGKALYVGISKYNPAQTAAIEDVFKDLHTPYVVHQDRYNLLDRHIENGLLERLAEDQTGLVTFSSLAQGLLTNRYLKGIPADSRAQRSDSPFLHVDRVEQTLAGVKQLKELAQNRGQSLAEMSLAWLLNKPAVTSVLVGASRAAQLTDSLQALKHTDFTTDELGAIDTVLKTMN